MADDRHRGPARTSPFAQFLGVATVTALPGRKPKPPFAESKSTKRPASKPASVAKPAPAAKPAKGKAEPAPFAHLRQPGTGAAIRDAIAPKAEATPRPTFAERLAALNKKLGR